ncbi:MAG: ATP-binding cassette domain-containing protein, partial [Vulcanimicrobiaceae bacterium]
APIEREAPHRIKQLGVAYIPQTANTFGGLTVEENLRMGAWLVRRDRAGVAARIEQAFATFPILAERRKKKASELSGGQARMLSIARETMSEPRLLLVDEPTAGLAPAVVAQVYGALRTACDSLGAAMLLVDQAIEDAVAIADDVVLLDLGRVRAAGPAGEFGPPRVRELIRECLAG